MSEAEAPAPVDAAPAPGSPAAPVPPSPWKKRIVVGGAVVTGLGVAAAGALFWWRSQAVAPLTDLIPDDSYLAATVDVEALRQGPLADLLSEGDAMAKKRAAGLLGSCADGAIAAVREVGLVVPGGATEEGSFAVAARLDTKGTWLAECDAELGAKGSALPRETDGAWTYLGASNGPRLAMHRGGLALWGREPFLHALAATAFKKESAHVYRQFVARLAETGHAPQAFASITLPADQRRIFAAAIEEREQGEGHAELFAIARAGVAATVDGPADTLHVAARFETDKPEAVGTLKTLFERLVQKSGESLEVRALGLGDAISGARVVAAGDAVVVTASTPLARLRMMARRLKLMGEMRKLARDAAPTPDAPPAP